jgi:cytochrome c-type biogenesis protein CcmF
MVFLFSIMFAVLSSAAYLFKFITKGRNFSAGLTHLGFSLFLLGILITFSNTVTLTSGPDGATQGSNVMLFKGQVKQVGDQLLSYQSSKEERDELFYQIDFLEKDESGNTSVKYSIYPSVKYNDRMGNVHNPDTRNLLKGDVYMYLTFAEDRSKRSAGGYSASESRNIALKETIKAGGKEVVFDSLDIKMLNTAGDNIQITALMSTTDSANNRVTLPLIYKLEGNTVESGIISIPGTDVRMRFDKVAEVPQAINISLLEKQPEFIVLKIMFFPWIIVLWIGSIIMFIGVTVALYKRARKAKGVV